MHGAGGLLQLGMARAVLARPCGLVFDSTRAGFLGRNRLQEKAESAGRRCPAGLSATGPNLNQRPRVPPCARGQPGSEPPDVAPWTTHSRPSPGTATPTAACAAPKPHPQADTRCASPPHSAPPVPSPQRPDANACRTACATSDPVVESTGDLVFERCRTERRVEPSGLRRVPV